MGRIGQHRRGLQNQMTDDRESPRSDRVDLAGKVQQGKDLLRSEGRHALRLDPNDPERQGWDFVKLKRAPERMRRVSQAIGIPDLRLNLDRVMTVLRRNPEV